MEGMALPVVRGGEKAVAGFRRVSKMSIESMSVTRQYQCELRICLLYNWQASVSRSCGVDVVMPV